MEGPLSKWTNVLHGWQYRWFVLGDEALSYYTSREKMLRRQQRGCIRLRGAQIGIDGENNSLFTVTVDGKVFHLQGRDQNERDQWVKALERVIHSKCGYYKPVADPPSIALKNHIANAEKQLGVLIEEVRVLEKSEPSTSGSGDRKEVQALLGSANRLLDIVKHSVIILQMAHKRVDGIAYEDDDDDKQEDDKDDDEVGDARKGSASNMVVPPLSYSSSEDEFFDAESMTGEKSPDFRRTSGRRQQSEDTLHEENGAGAASPSNSEPDWGDSGEDFDAIYDNNTESELGNVQQQHGSVLMHLLSQVSVGMDLTKVTLPTFILERRSLLEMYADFFAHPDDFIVSTRLSTPEERFISVVRYYLNAFYAARKSGVAKKPYNPILGETFRCRWKVPGLPQAGVKTTSGPFPGSDINQLTFVAEQVSHHPPISAFYAEVPGRKISFNAHIWTKSSFLGLSIGVANIGQGTVKLHEFDEEYTVTFPSGYGRSIMSTPWVELGGKVDIKCEKTGYHAEIEFLTKPFFGGKAHRISGNVFKDGAKRPLLTIKGEWNGVMMAKTAIGEEYVFIDVRSKEEVRKECESVNNQGDRESRRLWRHVTAALFHNRISAATNSKRWIEQRQRDEAKERKEKGIEWTSSLFQNSNQLWHYMHSFSNPLIAGRIPKEMYDDDGYRTTTTTTTRYVYSTPVAEPMVFGTPTLDTSYLKTIGGMVKCVALAFCLITFLCVVGGGPGYFSGAGFATFVSIFGFMVTLSLLLLYLFRVVDQLSQIPWIVGEMVFCFAWTIFFFIAGSMLAIAAMRFNGAFGWGIASFFAFGAMCTYGFSCYLLFLSWKANEVAHGGMSATVTGRPLQQQNNPKRVTINDEPFSV